MNTITLKDAKTLHEAVDAAMEQIAKQYGLTYQKARALCDREGTLFRTTVEMKVVTTASGQSLREVEFARYATLFGLEPSDFGAEFESRGKRFRLIGFDLKRRKFPLRCECLTDGKPYNVMESAGEMIRRQRSKKGV